jgi:hypothetical protein
MALFYPLIPQEETLAETKMKESWSDRKWHWCRSFNAEFREYLSAESTFFMGNITSTARACLCRYTEYLS